MAMFMIAEQIYLGTTAEELNISAANYLSRKETVDRFLVEQPNPSDFKMEFSAWIVTDPAGDRGPNDKVGVNLNPAPSCCGKTEYPSKVKMAKNLVSALHIAVKTKAKLVTRQERKQRLKICKHGCESYHAEADRCMKCGCWVNFKTWLEAWHCPIGKW